jgi:hypothetical protein
MNNRSNGGHDSSNNSRKGKPFVFSDALPQSISNPALRGLLLTALSLVGVHESSFIHGRRHASRTPRPPWTVFHRVLLADHGSRNAIEMARANVRQSKRSRQ